MLSFVNKNRALSVSLKTVSFLTVAVTFASFCILIYDLLKKGNYTELAGIVLITAIPFLAVTLIRRFIDAPRPYELIPIYEKLPKNKKGLSFPSRHVFSIFLISAVYCFYFTPVGIALAVLGVILAASRVVLGIHFLRDVVAGAVSGALCGALGVVLLKLFV